MRVTSETRTGRRDPQYTPMNSAIGIVIARRRRPTGFRERVDDDEREDREMMIMMTSTATSAATPPNRPSASRAI